MKLLKLKSNVPLRHRRKLWPVFVLITISFVIVVPLLPRPYSDTQVIIAAVGGLWALAFYLDNGHKERAKFMKELFEYFNDRYEKQNNDLQLLIRSKDAFTEKNELAFIDYFNLCAEEWVFYKLGYIYDRVWESWLNGMRQYGGDSRVAELWKRECATNSYYGFELPVK